jgi:hypothetical protein
MIRTRSFVLVVLAATAALRPVGAASLSELLAEAARNNPDIAASMRAWRAAAQVPTQVSTLPDPQVPFSTSPSEARVRSRDTATANSHTLALEYREFSASVYEVFGR